MTPDLAILGQITIDHVVPSQPGTWTEQLGGNALYAAAGARLCADPSRVGVVARINRESMGHAAERLLEAAGLDTAGLIPCSAAPMVEWFLYEVDGTRRTLPRLPELWDMAIDEETRRRRYREHLTQISATADEIPRHWCKLSAAHLAPQVESRHRYSINALAGRTFLTVDPSPHYTKTMGLDEFIDMLSPADAALPSEMEIAHLLHGRDWFELARTLALRGVRELVLKRGRLGTVIATRLNSDPIVIGSVTASAVDVTGAGDAFCGGYMACRAQGIEPTEAAKRAAAVASLVVETRGIEAALAISREQVLRRQAGLV
jgi:sugar/nucleoside kinase (ribokinase family)